MWVWCLGLPPLSFRRLLYTITRYTITRYTITRYTITRYTITRYTTIGCSCNIST